jgi:hypothetical protein
LPINLDIFLTNTDPNHPTIIITGLAHSRAYRAHQLLQTQTHVQETEAPEVTRGEGYLLLEGKGWEEGKKKKKKKITEKRR